MSYHEVNKLQQMVIDEMLFASCQDVKLQTPLSFWDIYRNNIQQKRRICSLHLRKLLIESPEMLYGELEETIYRNVVSNFEVNAQKNLRWSQSIALSVMNPWFRQVYSRGQFRVICYLS